MAWVRTRGSARTRLSATLPQRNNRYQGFGLAQLRMIYQARDQLKTQGNTQKSANDFVPHAGLDSRRKMSAHDLSISDPSDSP